MNNIINYSISKDYLKHWGINEALREIMQNFMDYGDYYIDYGREDIVISNTYKPESLEFLSIGKSDKKEGSRGKYGEGLKMALLIFARENKPIFIRTQTQIFKPFFHNTIAGETFAIEVEDYDEQERFSVDFVLDYEVWSKYYFSIIKPEDIIFDDNYYGRIVDKPKGNIYCQGLFVKHIDNLSKAYDINVAHLDLTRDRNLPKTFEVNWATSKINESQGKLKITDLSHSDTQYLNTIPTEVKQRIKPKLVGDAIVPTYKEKGKTIVINNDSIRDIVLKDTFFSRVINRLRNYLVSKLGVYEMLVKFKEKHVHSFEANQELDLILKRLK